jgi:uncharacterized protein with FMN-binding domain
MAGTRISNNLVSASCAAVLAVYAAGYARTQSAANRIAAQVAARRSIYPPPGHAATSRVKEVRLPAAPAAKPTMDTRLPPAESSLHLPQLSAPDAPQAAATLPSVAVPEPAAPAPEPKNEPAPVAAPAPKWKDGTYTGWGYSRHGNIEASVVIESGRIASAVISQCRTRYSCSVIDRLPPQVAERQSPDVDLVSGATQSADAFYGAVVEALGKAK